MVRHDGAPLTSRGAPIYNESLAGARDPKRLGSGDWRAAGVAEDGAGPGMLGFARGDLV